MHPRPRRLRHRERGHPSHPKDYGSPSSDADQHDPTPAAIPFGRHAANAELPFAAELAVREGRQIAVDVADEPRELTRGVEFVLEFDVRVGAEAGMTRDLGGRRPRCSRQRRTYVERSRVNLHTGVARLDGSAAAFVEAQ